MLKVVENLEMRRPMLCTLIREKSDRGIKNLRYNFYKEINQNSLQKEYLNRNAKG